MASTMDGYDPLAMPYIPSPMPSYSGGGMQNLDYMSVPSVMDLQDQYSNFDSEPYMRYALPTQKSCLEQILTWCSGDDLNFAPSAGLQHPAMLKRYSSGFEDPFAESTMAQFDRVAAEGLPESPSIDRDSKYLSFSLPQYNFTLLDDSFRRSSVNVNAQLHGMFFLAESQWPATPDTPAPPPELTCYRRNLFQITGSVTLPRNLRYVFTDDGSRIPIYELELAVSATESVEGNTVKIISVPWKTPANGEALKPDDKIEREPPTIPLDKMTGQDLDTDFTTFPIQWKRLQFRIATANNGRRKELQQHFTLHLKIMASLSTGGKISIAEAHSGAVIVRGRSPRNFAARKDLPLSSSSTARKHLPSASRGGNSATSVPQVTSAPKINTSTEDAPPLIPAFDPSTMDLKPTDPETWVAQGMHDPLVPSFSSAMNPPAVPAFLEGSPEQGTPGTFPFTFAQEMSTGSRPMSLHFGSDDEGGSPHPPQQTSRQSSRPPTSNPSPLLSKGPTGSYNSTSGTSPGQIHSQTRPRMHGHQSSMTSVPSSVAAVNGQPPMPIGPQRPELLASKSGLPYSAEGESVDQLYEYFPLGLDDWQPPVDAVFRPHVVHHSGPLPPDPRSPGGRHTSKRYFSDVV
jgi:hypothetical protein